MPSVESSTRIAYSKIRRDGSAEKFRRENQRRRRADQRQDFQEPREVVDDEAAAESRQPARRQPQLQHADKHQQTDRKAGDEARRLLAPIGAHHQQHHGADGQHELRQHGQQLITCTLEAHGALSC